MFEDYLGFGYRYNLIVEDNSEGFEWKPISVCTDSKELFDKQKVIHYFNLSEIFFDYVNTINNRKYRKIVQKSEWDPWVEKKK